jgi:tRNA pseudouridine38-40 synthase
LPFPVARLEGALNRRLPPDLRVRDAAEAPAGWHPRFSATAREYVYRIWRGDNAPYDRLRFTASYDGEWDDAAVSQARQALCGRHDFREFAKEAAKLDSTICDLQVLEERREDGETRWRLRANRFLRQMVCNLAGTLLAVAAGKVQPGDVAGALVERRSFKVVPAPPRGLVLMQVMYPPEAPGPAW